MIYVLFIIVLIIYVVFFKMSMDKIKNDYVVLMEDKKHFFEKKTQDILKSSKIIAAQQTKVRQSLSTKIKELEQQLEISEEKLKLYKKALFNEGRTRDDEGYELNPEGLRIIPNKDDKPFNYMVADWIIRYKYKDSSVYKWYGTGTKDGVKKEWAKEYPDTDYTFISIKVDEKIPSTKEFNNKDWLIMYKKHGNKENVSQKYHCNSCSRDEAKTQFRKDNGYDSVITMIKEV